NLIVLVPEQLEELFYYGDDSLKLHAVDAANEEHIVISGQAALECTAEGQRPGISHLTGDAAAVGQLRSTHDANQRGLAGAVLAENTDLIPPVHLQVDAIQDSVRAAAGAVALDDLLQADHSPSTVTETLRTQASATKLRLRFTTTS